MLLNRRAIKASLCMNPALAARVTLLPYALGYSSAARCVVRADNRNAGNGKLSCSASERCDKQQHAAGGGSAAHITICEPVTMTTLDSVLAKRAASLQAAPIAAVKLDVEGQECNVLSGGRSLFTSHRPRALVIEANRKHIQATATISRQWPQPLEAPVAVGDRAEYDQRVHALVEQLRAPSALYTAAGLDDYSGLDGGAFRRAGLTMQPPAQLAGLRLQLEALVDAGLDGDVYETGTWRAGTAIFMVCVLSLYEQFKGLPPSPSRHFWFFDSFEGFANTDNVHQALSSYLSRRVFAAPLELVLQSFATFGALHERVHFVKGLFEATIPAFGAPPRPISLLRLDGDLYSSTKVVLDHLYPKVQPSGYVLVDDYGWHPHLAGHVKLCRAAVDEFRVSRNLTNESAPMLHFHDVWHWRVPPGA